MSISNGPRQVVELTATDSPDTGPLEEIWARFLCVTNPGEYQEPPKAQVEEHIAIIMAWVNGLNYPETYTSKYERMAIIGGGLVCTQHLSLIRMVQRPLHIVSFVFG